MADSTPHHHYDDTLGVGESLGSISSEESVNLLVKLQQSLICPICQDIMFAPCVTSCGHTFCYDCLYEWFKSRDRKSCPNCRTHLNQRPCISVGLREVADVLTHAISEKDSSKRQHFRETRSQALKDYEDDLKYHGKPFPIAFEDQAAMVDREDDVSRCPSCHWEIQGGYCENCGTHIFTYDESGYLSANLDDDDHDEEEEEDEVMDNSEYEQDGFVVSDDGSDEEYSVTINRDFSPDLSVDGIELPEPEFISLDEDEPPSDGRIIVRRRPVLLDESDEEEETAAPLNPQPVLLSDNDDGEEEDDEIIPRRNPAFRPIRHISVISDDDGDDSLIQNPQRTASQHVTLGSEEESNDSDNENENETFEECEQSLVDDDEHGGHYYDDDDDEHGGHYYDDDVMELAEQNDSSEEDEDEYETE